MTSRQQAEVIIAALAARRWAGVGGNDPVFGAVKASASNVDPFAFINDLRVPYAIWRRGTVEADEETADLEIIVHELALVFESHQDEIGTTAILGGSLPDVGRSPGQGLLRGEDEVKATIRELGPEQGLRLRFRGTGTSEVILWDGRVFATSVMRFSGFGTAAET